MSTRNFEEYRAEVLEQLGATAEDIRNEASWRAKVLEALGAEYTDEDTRNFGRYRLKVLENLSGGGSGGGGDGSSYALLTTFERNVTHSDSNASQKFQTNVPNLWESSLSKIIYIRIYDKEGKRNGYFYGSDSLFFNHFGATGSSLEEFNSSYKTICGITSGGEMTPFKSSGNTGSGVYPYSILKSDDIKIYAKTHTTYAPTINSTYVFEVYALDFPNGVPIY